MRRDFSAMEPYERQFERMGFREVRVGGAGTDSIAMDVKWPRYEGLVERRVGNSGILTHDGELRSYNLRLPGFPKDEYDSSLPRSIVADAAESVDMDLDRYLSINTWGDFHAYHIKYAHRQVESEGWDEYTMEDMIQLTRVAKDRLDAQFDVEPGGFL
jgi:hypothetical protein